MYCPSCGAILEAGCTICPVCDTEIDSQPPVPDDDNTIYLDGELDFGDDIKKDPEGTSLTIVAQDDLFANKLDTTLYTSMVDRLEKSHSVDDIDIENFGGAKEEKRSGNTGDQPNGSKGVPPALVVAIVVIAAIAVALALSRPWDMGTVNGDSTQSETAATESEIESSTEPDMDTVQLTVTGQDGTTRVVDIHRYESTERVLPDSNDRTYSVDELADLSDAERCIAWNEIIASANGYSFKNPALAGYFNDCSWYSPDPSANASSNLSDAARANIDTLQSMTDNWWKNLPTA